jgi:phosphate transport system substrate-binding protein
MAQDNALIGAGSSLSYPLISKMIDDFGRANHINVNYQSIGSGQGLALLANKTTDFAIADVPLTTDRTKRFGHPVVYVPLVTGVVAVAYNVPGIKSTLKLNRDILAAIYLGKITNWNDARIAAVNSTIKLPSLRINVIYRSDDSGTASIFINYINTNVVWIKSMGKGVPAKWPIGTGVRSNSGIAGLIRQSLGSIGFVGLPYATQLSLPIIALQNKAGNFIKAGSSGYSITGTTGIWLYKEQNYNNRSAGKVVQLMKFLRYTLRQGQPTAKQLGYQPLTASANLSAQKALHAVTYNGKSLNVK